MSQPIDPRNRFTARMPCPVCGGIGGAPRGKGLRCHGYLSTDGGFAHCARPEHAGPLELERGDTYAHRLRGRCLCGSEHAPAVRSTGNREPLPPVEAIYPYFDEKGAFLFEVVRHVGKVFRQRRYDANGKPIWKLDGVRRVLYHLPEILEAPADATTIYIVEGERDVESLEKLGLIATTNPGGAGKWRPEYGDSLVGRDVVVIPDQDDVGRKHGAEVMAAILGHARRVRLLNLPGPGKDVSDWVAAGGTGEQLAALVAAPTEVHPAGELQGKGKKLVRPSRPGWFAELRYTERGLVKAAPVNAVIVLANDERWAGVLAWNEHSQQINYRSAPPWDAVDHPKPTGIWTENDDRLLLYMLERQYDFGLTLAQIRGAVETIARRTTYHPIRQYLDSLVWDGVPRVDTWLSRYLGASSQPATYLQKVGRWALVSAVARAMVPGEKVDTMMIFEGGTGERKSSAIAALGGAWAASLDAMVLASTDKDALMILRQHWIIELEEIDSLDGRSWTRLKANVSRTSDPYRRPYGRDPENVPRSSILIGTTNADTYLADVTGDRRYHPVRVGTIDLEALQLDRDQLWAEALHLYRTPGRRWWPDKADVPEITEQQEQRRAPHPWEQIVAQYIRHELMSWDEEVLGPPFVTTADVLKHLHIEVGRRTKSDEMRVADCLRVLGAVRGKQRRVEGIPVWPYYLPRPAAPQDVQTSLPMGEEA